MVYDPEAELDHLMAGSGGARITDKALHTYFFVRNGIRLYKRHGLPAFLPLYVLKQGFYGALKAAYNLNPKIFVKTIQAIKDGLTKSKQPLS